MTAMRQEMAFGKRELPAPKGWAVSWNFRKEVE